MRAREPYRSCPACSFGYCAPKRCYCGHEECAAFDSWRDPYREPVQFGDDGWEVT